LVVILEAPKGRRVSVAAASHELVEDDSTLVVYTEEGLNPIVWPQLRAVIPLFTLDQRLADVVSSSAAALQKAMAGAPRGDWVRIIEDLDDRSLVEADLGDRLAALADAEWVPAAREGESLQVLVADAGIAPSDLAGSLGITPGDARRLLQGRRQPTETEMGQLAALLGRRPGGTTLFDPELLEDLDQPKIRPQLRLFASRRGLEGDEPAVRRLVAAEVMAVAARHREPGRRNWEALITEVLDAD
jgi:hypothetical protein